MLKLDCFPCLLKLSKRGNAVKVPCYVLVVDSTVMFCHLKGGVPQQFLKGKGVAAAIDKILAGEGMPESVDAGFLNAPAVVITVNSLPQGFFCHFIPVFITEQIISGRTFADNHIITENIYHHTTQRDYLNLARLCMAESNLF